MRFLCFFAASFLLADPTLPVPSNLHEQSIPPIPVALADKLARYNESRSAMLLDWAPGKREILISTRFGNVPQIHRVAMPGGARSQLTFFPDRTAGAKYQPVAGDFFVFEKDTGGGEFYQIYRYDQSTGDTTLLTDGSSRNLGVLWQRDGKRIVYSSTKRNGRDTDLYVMDPRDPKSARMLLQVEGGGWSAEDWSWDGRKILVSERRSVNDSTLFLVDAETGAKEMLTPSGTPASYSGGQFTRDGSGIYLVTDRDAEFERLAYLDLKSRKFSFLRPDVNWDVEDLALSQDGRHLAYVVNQEGSSLLRVMDTETKRDLDVPKMPNGTIGNVRWASNNVDLGFTFGSARTPADVYSVSVNDGKLTRWTTSETGGLNAEKFSEAEVIRWKSFDGRTISGLLYRPPSSFSGPRPVIVNIHGGPEGQSRPTYLARNNYYLNELGVALIFPNVRGSLGYGKTYRNLDNGIKREDSVKDIGALLDWIGMQKDLDSSRIMVTGGSYGGYMTLASMVHYNDRFKCAVDVVGISNFLSFFERTQAYRRDLRRVEYGDERDPQIHEFFTKISPLNHADAITKPMFIVAGRNDPRVPMKEGEQMAAAIRKNGAPVWYLVADDEGHGFAKKQNQDYQFAATVLFVQKFLLN